MGIKKGNPRGLMKITFMMKFGVLHTDDGGCIIIAGTGDEYDVIFCNM